MFARLFVTACCLFGVSTAFTLSSTAMRTARRATPSKTVLFADVVEELAEGELTGEPEALLADMGDVGEEALMEAAQNFGPPKPYLNAQALEAAINRWKRHESDVGSPEAQIAQAHTKIIYLSEHLQLHPKDYASRRGLIAIVNKRRRMLNFLFKENPSKALEMAKELGIRFKPPGSVQTKEEKYSSYKFRK